MGIFGALFDVYQKTGNKAEKEIQVMCDLFYPESCILHTNFIYFLLSNGQQDNIIQMESMQTKDYIL